MSGKWVNDDGLLVKFNRTAGETKRAGEYNSDDGTHVVEVDVRWDDLEAFGTTTFLSDAPLLPSGAHIKSAEFYVTTAFAGATATLTFGTYSEDRTVLDEDGIDAAIAVTAIDAVGDTIACDGDQVGTTLTEQALLTAQVGTADFTAGQGFLRITYIIP